MKKIVLICAFAFFCVTSIFSEGWFTGGTVSIGFESDSEFDDETITSFKLSPTFGFIVNNKFDMGLNPSFSIKTNPNHYKVAGDDVTWGIGIFARYSFFDISGFSIFGRLGFEYLYSSTYVYNYNYNSGYGYDYNDISHIFRINISPVFQFNILDNLSLYTSFGSIYFSHYSYEGTDHVLNNFGIDFSTGISLGFHIVFGSSRNTFIGGTSENQSNSSEDGASGNQRNSSRQSREQIPVPQLGEPTLLQIALNSLPAVPMGGKNLKFEFGGDIWIAKVNGQNFLAGNCIFEESGNGHILTLTTTNVWSGAVDEAIDFLQNIGMPLGPAAGPLRTAARLAARLAKWISLKESSIVLEYNEGPPASLRFNSR